MIFTAISLIALLPLVIYVYYKHKHSYWARKSVPYFPPSIPFGNIGDFVLRKNGVLDVFRDFHTRSKQNGYKYTGFYMYHRKGLLFIDPALIKRCLTTDFQYFYDRDMYYDEVNDPLTATLVSLTGHRWKNLRSKITPTFSSGKLKMMFNTIINCADELINILQTNIGSSIEIKDLLSRFTTDVIGSTAFGIDCNSLKNPDTDFRKYSSSVLKQDTKDIIKLGMFKNCPSLAKFLKMKQLNPEVTNFFMSVVKQTIDYREQNNIESNDFMQLLIRLKNNQKLDEEDNQSTKGSNLRLTFNEIAAQAFTFFLAGYETSSTVTSFALFEIARNESIQDKMRREIFNVIKKYDGKITYDAIMEMEYMEKVILESMRLYPAVGILLRKCTKDYQIPDTEVIVEKGTPIFISVWGLHSDPEYFPEPNTFDPTRFDKENVQKRPEHCYLPFGDGPRICIGLRFAMTQIKIALAILLSNFKFTLNSQTKVPLIFDKNKPAVLNVDGGIWLNVLDLNKDEY